MKMSTADDFVRWYEARAGLDEATHRHQPHAQLDALRLTERAQLETLIRALVSADQLSKISRARLRADVADIIEVEKKRIWDRLDQFAAVLRQDHEVPEPVDELSELSAGDFGGAGD